MVDVTFFGLGEFDMRRRAIAGFNKLRPNCIGLSGTMKGQALAPMLPEGEAMPIVVVVQGMGGGAAR